MPKKKPGRPAGSKNSPAAIVEVVPAQCPGCQSTARESIRILKTRPIAGTAPGGAERTHIVWRRVRCKACQRYFTEMTHENRT